MTPPIDIRADHLRIVQDVLHRHLQDGVKVWVFGSRASWMTKDSSDLDLALEGDTDIPARSLSALDVAFEESDLPYAVDIVDVTRISERFRRIVTHQRVRLPESDRPRPTNPNSDSVGTRPSWRNAALGDVAEFLSGGTPSKDQPAYWNGSIPWASAKDMKSFRLHDTADHVTAEGLANGTREVPAGSVFLLTRGMTLLNELPVCVSDRPMAFNQDVKALRPRPGLHPGFLPYLVLGSKGRLLGLVDLAGHGTGRLNSDELKSLNILLPPLPEQCGIAHVLGTLDDKIELNRRMNATLEALARALFRSWFVDFDPVRAKMEGRDTGLPKDIADLFPDRLVDSELGEIPRGWTVGTLGDIATAPRSGIDPGQVADDTPYIGLEHMPRMSVALTDWGRAGSVSSTKTAFENRDVLFGKLRPYFHKVGIAPVNGVCSTDIVVLKARMPKWSAFILACVSSFGFVRYASQTSTGTKMPRTSWHTMSRYELCRPADAVAAVFQHVVSPILKRIVANVHGSRTPGRLRDALLPKLVSGELRVIGLEVPNGRDDLLVPGGTHGA